MSNIHPSHFFDKVETYLRRATGPKPLQALEELVRSSGCPEDLIGQTVNGALLDFIWDVMPPQTDDVKIYESNGDAVVENKKLYTLQQWRDNLIHTINGIDAERIEALLNYMIQKEILIVHYNTGFVYRGTAQVRRIQLTL